MQLFQEARQNKQVSGDVTGAEVEVEVKADELAQRLTENEEEETKGGDVEEEEAKGGDFEEEETKSGDVEEEETKGGDVEADKDANRIADERK